LSSGTVFGALILNLINTLVNKSGDVCLAKDIQLVYLVADEISATCKSMLTDAAVKVRHNLLNVL
jgi:hypothetical protein